MQFLVPQNRFFLPVERKTAATSPEEAVWIHARTVSMNFITIIRLTLLQNRTGNEKYNCPEKEILKYPITIHITPKLQSN